MGAAILAARSCLRMGTGLLTAHLPGRGEIPMQTSLPEAMVSLDSRAVTRSDRGSLFQSPVHCHRSWTGSGKSWKRPTVKEPAYMVRQKTPCLPRC